MREKVVAVAAFSLVLVLSMFPMQKANAQQALKAEFCYSCHYPCYIWNSSSPSSPEEGGIVYVNENVTFDASGSSVPEPRRIVEYIWDFGDGTPLLSRPYPTIDYVYAIPGDYMVQLIVRDNSKPPDYDGVPGLIRVRDGSPQADFTFSPEPRVVCREVIFNASSTTYWNKTWIANYTWNFGDDTPPVTTPNDTITHHFTFNRNFPVTLIVTTKEGYKSKPVEKTVGILLIEANFTCSPTPPYLLTYPKLAYLNENVWFNPNRSLCDPQDHFTKFKWDFDDGNITIVENETRLLEIIPHRYNQTGNYNVSLTAITNLKANDTVYLSIEVWLRPYVHFLPPTPLYKGQSETFDASNSNITWPDEIGNFTWDFGDGNRTTVTDPIIRHTYVHSGNYSVSLTVETEKGAINSASDVINASFPIPGKTQDVGIVWNSVVFSATEGYPDIKPTIYIWVTVRNEGTSLENFYVTAYRKNNLHTVMIDTIPVTLNSSATYIAVFLFPLFNITGKLPIYLGTYQISINVTLPADEYTPDNTCIASIVKVKLWGDINFDGIVDGGDLALLGLAWYSNRTGDSNWNQSADLNGDGVIDGGDLGILGQQWFKTAKYVGCADCICSDKAYEKARRDEFSLWNNDPS